MYPRWMRPNEDPRTAVSFRRSGSPSFEVALWLCAVALTQSAPLPLCARRTAAAVGVDPRRVLLGWLLLDACASVALWQWHWPAHPSVLAGAVALQHVLVVCVCVGLEREFCAPQLFLAALPAVMARAALGPAPLVFRDAMPLTLATTCAYGVHVVAAAVWPPTEWAAIAGAQAAVGTEGERLVRDALASWLALVLFVAGMLAIACGRERAERLYFQGVRASPPAPSPPPPPPRLPPPCVQTSADASRARQEVMMAADKADRLLAATLPKPAYQAVIAQVAARRALAADGLAEERASASAPHEPLVLRHEFVVVLHCRVHGLNAHFARGRQAALRAAETLAELLADAQFSLAAHHLTLVQVSATAFVATSKTPRSAPARHVRHALDAALSVVRAHRAIFDKVGAAPHAHVREAETLRLGSRFSRTSMSSPPTDAARCSRDGASLVATVPLPPPCRCCHSSSSDSQPSAPPSAASGGSGTPAIGGTFLSVGVHCGHVVEGFASKLSTSGASFGVWGDAVKAAATLSAHMPAVARELGGGRPSSGVLLTAAVAALLPENDLEADFALHPFADEPAPRLPPTTLADEPAPRPASPVGPPLGRPGRVSGAGASGATAPGALAQLRAELAEVSALSQGALLYALLTTDPPRPTPADGTDGAAAAAQPAGGAQERSARLFAGANRTPSEGWPGINRVSALSLPGSRRNSSGAIGLGISAQGLSGSYRAYTAEQSASRRAVFGRLPHTGTYSARLTRARELLHLHAAVGESSDTQLNGTPAQVGGGRGRRAHGGPQLAALYEQAWLGHVLARGLHASSYRSTRVTPRDEAVRGAGVPSAGWRRHVTPRSVRPAAPSEQEQLEGLSRKTSVDFSRTSHASHSTGCRESVGPSMPAVAEAPDCGGGGGGRWGGGRGGKEGDEEEGSWGGRAASMRASRAANGEAAKAVRWGEGRGEWAGSNPTEPPERAPLAQHARGREAGGGGLPVPAGRWQRGSGSENGRESASEPGARRSSSTPSDRRSSSARDLLLRVPPFPLRTWFGRARSKSPSPCSAPSDISSTHPPAASRAYDTSHATDRSEASSSAAASARAQQRLAAEVAASELSLERWLLEHVRVGLLLGPPWALLGRGRRRWALALDPSFAHARLRAVMVSYVRWAAAGADRPLAHLLAALSLHALVAGLASDDPCGRGLCGTLPADGLGARVHCVAHWLDVLFAAGCALALFLARTVDVLAPLELQSPLRAAGSAALCALLAPLHRASAQRAIANLRSAESAEWASWTKGRRASAVSHASSAASPAGKPHASGRPLHNPSALGEVPATTGRGESPQASAPGTKRRQSLPTPAPTRQGSTTRRESLPRTAPACSMAHESLAEGRTDAEGEATDTNAPTGPSTPPLVLRVLARQREATSTYGALGFDEAAADASSFPQRGDDAARARKRAAGSDDARLALAQ
ncbi:hypothetical protein T492DRAFT_916589, partial [Pavlovales sp. CCMP2436]